MGVFQNADELLAQFKVVQECSKQQPSPYKYVLDWFKKEFNTYKEQPDFKVIDLEAFQKKQEEKKEQKGA